MLLVELIGTQTYLQIRVVLSTLQNNNILPLNAYNTLYNEIIPHKDPLLDPSNP